MRLHSATEDQGSLYKYIIMNSFEHFRKLLPLLAVDHRLLMSSAVTASKQLERDCWSCLKRISCQTFFCECGKVQSFSPTWNYFDYFGFTKPSMRIDPNELSRKKRKLQMVFHPDKFARSTKEEKEIATTVSTQINDAFTVLSNPITRAEYILTLNGNPCSSDDVAVTDTAFLADVFEVSEHVDDLAEMVKTEECKQTLERVLAALYAIVMTRWGREMDQLTRFIEAANWDAAHQTISRLRYYERLKKRLLKLRPAFAMRGIRTPFNGRGVDCDSSLG
ncbi:Iron-sulfur cluster co-chaperone protein HscB [Taenia crassiceps]|uniref:Iron-sulfur cluster co-chaperone protein HscB n=1 Tax=Taenia crassiceps TaxID=6207 RepID=A0ABR4QJW8_9CEST